MPVFCTTSGAAAHAELKQIWSPPFLHLPIRTYYRTGALTDPQLRSSSILKGGKIALGNRHARTKGFFECPPPYPLFSRRPPTQAGIFFFRAGRGFFLPPLSVFPGREDRWRSGVARAHYLTPSSSPPKKLFGEAKISHSFVPKKGRWREGP